MFGTTSMGLAMVIAKFRWAFVSLAFLGLGMSFYLTWWKRPTRRNKVVFAVTVLLSSSAMSIHMGPFSDGAATTTMGGTAKLQCARYRVRGVDCERCAERLTAAVESVEGVVGSKLDATLTEVIVWISPGTPDVHSTVQESLEKQGFATERVPGHR